MELFKSELNNGKALKSFSNNESVVLSCSICDHNWTWSKKYFVKRGVCEQVDRHKVMIRLILPQLLKYSTNPSLLKNMSIKSAELHDWRCLDCNVIYRKPISTVAKDEILKINPCRICRPGHRIKTGKLFLANNPDLSFFLLDSIDDDIYEATLTKYNFLFNCGHLELIRPADFIDRKLKCTKCKQADRARLTSERGIDPLNKTAACKRCGKIEVFSKSTIKKGIRTGCDLFCKKCRYVRNGHSLEEIINQWVEVYPKNVNQNDLNNLTESSAKRITWKCRKVGHTWSGYIYATRDSCPKCNSEVNSKAEIEIADFIESKNIEIIRNDRDIIKPLEIDILVRDKKIAIEYNGLYWHAGKKSGEKMLEKMQLCNSLNYQLIIIWEDDFQQNPNLIKKILLHKLGISNDQKIYARKTKVQKISSALARDFMINNHIQGASRSQNYYALIADDEPVAVMNISMSKEIIKIDRYATSKIVPGGFSKLLSFIKNKHQNFKMIETFSDNEISDGKLYERCGFTMTKELASDYCYLWKGKRIHKFNFRKSRFEGDPNLKYVENFTETELAELNNLQRIWDLGKKKWTLNIKK